MDCVQTLLGRTLEVVGPAQLAGLWLTACGCEPPDTAAAAAAADSGGQGGGGAGCSAAGSGAEGGSGPGSGKAGRGGGRGGQQQGRGRGAGGRGRGRGRGTQGSAGPAVVPQKRKGTGAGSAGTSGTGAVGRREEGGCGEGGQERLQALVVPEGGDTQQGRAMAVARSVQAAAARWVQHNYRSISYVLDVMCVQSNGCCSCEAWGCAGAVQ